MEKVTQELVALVTGSTQGIGREIARALSSKGYAVVVTSRQKERAEHTAEQLRASGERAIGLAFNIEEVAHLNRVLAQTIDAFGRLDILVNNAISYSCALPSAEYTDNQIIQAVTHSLSHTYLLCQKAFPHLNTQKGCVINIGSSVARRHLLGLPIYGMVKGALLQMTKVLASEWATAGVRVNAINPGFVRTEAFANLGMNQELIDRNYEFYSHYQPLGGVGVPQSIGTAAAFLASPQARFITGSILDIDGGYSIKGFEPYR